MTDLTAKPSAATSRYERTSQATLLRAVTVAAIIVAGVLIMNGLEKAFDLKFNKDPMPLRRELPTLSKSLGSPVRYVAKGHEVAEECDTAMPEEQVGVLGTTQYLLRRYVDQQKLPTDPTAVLHINLNYYPQGNSVVHVPENCWAGNGMIEAPDSRRVFEVPGVRRADGSVITLPMRMISFQTPEGGDDAGHLRNVAYVFEVNGDYVAMPKEVTSRFWRASAKYAYVTKIEVTVGEGEQYCSKEQAQAAIADFIRAALPEIEECLPDRRDAATGGSVAVPDIRK